LQKAHVIHETPSKRGPSLWGGVFAKATLAWGRVFLLPDPRERGENSPGGKRHEQFSELSEAKRGANINTHKGSRKAVDAGGRSSVGIEIEARVGKKKTINMTMYRRLPHSPAGGEKGTRSQKEMLSNLPGGGC